MPYEAVAIKSSDRQSNSDALTATVHCILSDTLATSFTKKPSQSLNIYSTSSGITVGAFFRRKSNISMIYLMIRCAAISCSASAKGSSSSVSNSPSSYTPSFRASHSQPRFAYSNTNKTINRSTISEVQFLLRSHMTNLTLWRLLFLQFDIHVFTIDCLNYCARSPIFAFEVNFHSLVEKSTFPSYASLHWHGNFQEFNLQ